MFIPLHDDTTYREQTVTSSIADFAQTSRDFLAESFLVGHLVQQLVAAYDYRLVACE